MKKVLATLAFLVLGLPPATREQSQQSSVMTIALPVTVVIPNAGAIPVTTQGGPAYTLQTSDNGSVVVFTGASRVTVTVPSGLGSGFNVTLLQAGAGVVAPVAGSPSVSIHQRLLLTKTAGQWAQISLLAFSADTFVLSGDLQ